jgi:hypothetical protein
MCPKQQKNLYLTFAKVQIVAAKSVTNKYQPANLILFDWKL